MYVTRAKERKKNLEQGTKEDLVAPKVKNGKAIIESNSSSEDEQDDVEASLLVTTPRLCSSQKRARNSYRVSENNSKKRLVGNIRLTNRILTPQFIINTGNKNTSTINVPKI